MQILIEQKELGDKFWLLALPLPSTFGKKVLRWKEDYSSPAHLRRLLGALLCLCVKIPFAKVLTSHGKKPRPSERNSNCAFGECILIVFR